MGVGQEMWVTVMGAIKCSKDEAIKDAFNRIIFESLIVAFQSIKFATEMS